MKRFTRFAALLLVGALALALLAGCGTSDIAKKKALLTALQSAAQSPENEGYTVIEDNVLAAEKQTGSLHSSNRLGTKPTMRLRWKRRTRAIESSGKRTIPAMRSPVMRLTMRISTV